MRPHRYRHASLVELSIIGVIILVLAGVGIATRTNVGDATAALGAAASPPASPTAMTTPAIGDVFDLPSTAAADVTLVRTDQTPVLSEVDAVQVVRDYGIPVNQEYGGRQITCTATYGIGTIGHAVADGFWAGPQNFPIKGTDKLLDHAENRPLWVIDCDNVYGGGTRATYKHGVHVVDAQTRSLLETRSYGLVSEIPAPSMPGN